VKETGDGRAPAPEPRWGLGDAAIGYVVGFFASAVAASVWATASGNPRSSTLGTTAAGLIGLWVGLAGAPLLSSRFKGTRSLTLDFGLRMRLLDIPVGLGLGLVCQVVVSDLLYLPLRFTDPNLERQLSRPAQQLTGLAHGSAVAFLAVLVVVCAPVVEELFFRGLLLRSLARRFGNRWAVVGSALLFGLAHFEPLQFPALVAFGLVLGVVAVRTGRLGPGIFAHAGFNAFTVAYLVSHR
jgi:membrane protease YdiL (CAAX protease family)